MLFFLGCHLIDLILSIQGMPKEVIPLNTSSNIDNVKSDDIGMVVFKYENGVSFAKSCASEIGGFVRRQLVVCGSKKTIEINPLETIDGGGLQHATVRSTTYEEAQKLYAGMTFKGTINGQSATLYADQYQAFTLKIGTSTIFKASSFEISSMSNGGVDYAKQEILLYYVDTRDDTFYSYKFRVDPVAKTFEYIAHDSLLGYYEAETAYVMFDGYGTGFINFNSKSYAQTDFSYQKLDNIVTITYKNTISTFEYGKNAQFSIDKFGNVLTVHSGACPALQGDLPRSGRTKARLPVRHERAEAAAIAREHRPQAADRLPHSLRQVQPDPSAL